MYLCKKIGYSLRKKHERNWNHKYRDYFIHFNQLIQIYISFLSLSIIIFGYIKRWWEWNMKYFDSLVSYFKRYFLKIKKIKLLGLVDLFY